MTAALCPHCSLQVSDDADASFPRVPLQCPHCRLAIGPGRAHLQDGDTEVTHGSAAGVLANAARRQGDDVADEKDIQTAMTAAAESVGTPLKRLRLLDYERVSREGGAPSVSAILATHGTWKRARLAASGVTTAE